MKVKTKNTDVVNEGPVAAKPAGTEMDIPASLIVADDDFNSRMSVDGEDESEGYKKGNDLASLAASIKKDGQLSPVLVAVVKDHPGKYFLVYGFRRFYAITRSEEQGGLGRATVRATLFNPLDSKGKSKETTIEDLYYINLIENEARKELTPFERARSFARLAKHGQTGANIATRVGLDKTYVNRLIAAMEMHPKIIEHWKQENSPEFEKTNRTRVLTTDRINKLTHMRIKDKDGKSTDKWDHESQLKAFEDLVTPKVDPAVNPDAQNQTNPQTPVLDGDKRASLAQIKRAIMSVHTAYTKSKSTKDIARFEAILEGLRFAFKPDDIEGVLKVTKDGDIKDVGGNLVSAPRELKFDRRTGWPVVTAEA